MTQPKFYTFLITDGENFSLTRQYAESFEEAKEYRTKSLNYVWAIVEDVETIKSYIENEKALTASLDPEYLERTAHLTKDFNENLAQLESQLSNEVVEKTTFTIDITKNNKTLAVKFPKLNEESLHMKCKTYHNAGYEISNIKECSK